MYDRRIMTSTQHSGMGSDFLEARTRAEQEWSDQQRRAVRIIAGLAHDRTEFTDLLSMLDLDDPDLRAVTLSRRLAAYIHQVAVAIGVSAEATGYDVSDTATAHLDLNQRCAMRPDHDLILVWDERLGWYVTEETSPTTKAPTAIAYLNGDIVPPPAAVARFVAEAIAGRGGLPIRRVQPPTERTVLATKMAAASREPVG
jgi:hypothetical protein